jgi:hypothetical protein
MRLLQLATGPDQLIDLHPHVTVVAGLDPDARSLLVDTVQGLARGTAPGATGLLEAHGVLFELSDDMLALLDVEADGLRPVVVASELPTVRPDTLVRDRLVAERALAQLEERWATENEELGRRRQARDAAADALARARRDAYEAEAGASDRIRLIDELTAVLDQAAERRRRLLEERAEREPQVEQALARRAEIEASTSDVRSRHQEAAVRCSELAGRLDQARLGLDPDAIEIAEAAAAQLASVEAAVEAERAAERAAPDVPEGEPAAERLARAHARLEELEKRLAAFGPTEAFDVSTALEHLREQHEGALVPSPEAQELAEQLAEVEADLAATSGVGVTSGGLAAGRQRLDDARHRLLEAEQAVRNPELPRNVVDQLELAHADVLEALEKADGRFAGSRAQRRVESARAAEQAVLDQLGFGSYSDYMMGYSLQNVDPVKEAALDAARDELSAAEDAWRLLQAETEAELARAERMERRRLLLDEARVLLGRPVPTGEVVAELRAHRVPAVVPPHLVDALRHTLEQAGVAVGDEELDREDLILLAEAWVEEAVGSVAREQEVRREVLALMEERDAAMAAVEAEAAAAAGPPPEEEREARLHAARSAVAAAEARRLAHLDAERAVAAASDDLAAAADAERRAADEAADAEAAVAAAVAETERLSADLERITAELESLVESEGAADEHLRSLTEHESSSPEDLEREVGEAERALATAEEALQSSSATVEELAAERAGAARRVASLSDDGPGDEGSIAEEVEWYLLARLAAQRAVSLGGSVPLLLDDALGGLDEDQLGHVLGRLERMADAVQVIVVSDDPMAASWALLAGDDRAALVRPGPP